MVAYSFKKQFVTPIMTGSKRQTIRADRKRHAREGETLQLYTGMRTKQCTSIGTAICFSVTAVTIDVRKERIQIGGADLRGLAAMDIFARQDGFHSWEGEYPTGNGGMRTFWKANHPDAPIFSGVLIQWKDFVPAALVTAAVRALGGGE